MSLTVIIILIAIGLFLLIVELLIIPGITVAGIGGLLLMIAGVYFAYKSHDNITGNYVLLGSLSMSLFAVILSLRTKTWRNVGLNSNSDSRVVSFEKEKIKIGDEGITITRLAPIGKAMINDIICEAKSHAEFVDENTTIIVTKINNNQVIVKPKNIE